MSLNHWLPPARRRPPVRPRLRIDELEDRAVPAAGFAALFGGLEEQYGRSIAVDASGNVVTAGEFYGTGDFNPGAANFPLSSGQRPDAFISKLDAAGNFLWAGQFASRDDNPSDQAYVSATATAVDSLGNVFVAGFINGTIDFDPGPGTTELTCVGDNDAYVCKLDAAGNFLWVRKFSGASVSRVEDMAVDGQGNVYTTGEFVGSCDFDPGTGVATLTSAGFSDAYVSKLDAAGTFVWAKRLGGVEEQKPSGLAVDGSGNVYTAGLFTGATDFDPGAGTARLTPISNADAYISKLDTAGNFAWARQFAVASLNAVHDFTADAAGNVYTTGGFTGTVDFDPGPGVHNLTVAGGDGFGYLSKLDAAGAFVLVEQLEVEAMSLAADGAGGMYTAGNLAGTRDFDPGPGVFNLTSAGQSDVYVRKLDAAGNFAWARRLGGNGSELAHGVAADGAGTVYTTGTLFGGVADFDPGLGTFNLVGVDRDDAFVSKLLEAKVDGVVWDDHVNTNGVREAGDLPVAGAVVELLNAAGASLATQVTGADGRYSFVSPPASATGYRLQFRPPAGFNFTGQNVGNDATDSDVSAAGLSALFDLDGFTQPVIDAGLTGAAPAFGFASPINGAGADEGRAVVTDAAGFVYTTGTFSGSADFDPGPGNYPLTSGGSGSQDGYVAKYAPGGALVWAKSYGGAANDLGLDLAVDAAGNVYTTGFYVGDIDADPGPGVVTLPGLGANNNAFVSKLDPNGQFVWAKRLGAGATGLGYGVATDAAGNVLVGGQFRGSGVFGAVTLNSVSPGDFDVYVAKLTAAGDLAWARQLGGAGNDELSGLAVDAAGNVVTTGYFRTTADFDPGAGVFPLTPASAGVNDAFVSKLDAGGNFVWAKRFGAAGDDVGMGVATDAQGNVYATGWFAETVDFDPGAGEFRLTSPGVYNAYVSKLDAAGVFVWAKQFAGAGDGQGRAVVTDAAGGVYVAGFFNGTADFDPGPGAHAMTAAVGDYDAYVTKLDEAGNFVLARRWGAGGSDLALGVAVDAAGAAYTAGLFSSTVDFDPSAASHTKTAAGPYDAFVHTLVPPSVVSGVVWDDRNGNGLRDALEPLVAGAVAELLDSSGVSLGAQITGADGAYSFTAPPNISADAYTVQFRPPAGFGFTAAGAGSSPVAATGRTAGFPVPGNAAVAKDAGLTGAAPAFGFAIQARATANGEGRGITTDAAGNVYVTGNFVGAGSNDFDPGPGFYPLASGGGADAYVAKYTAAGALVWAKRLGGTADDKGIGIAVAVDGSVYTTGFFSGTGDFDPSGNVVNLTGAGGGLYTAYVSKLDADGDFVWAKRFGGTSAAVGYGVGIDAGGNVYSAGHFAGTANFNQGSGTDTLTSANGNDGYVSKLDAAGNFIWARRMGGTSNDEANHLAVDAAGNAVVTGFFAGSAGFGNFTLNSAGGSNDAFVGKLNSNGSFVWAKRLGGTASDVGRGVRLDGQGNVYSTGLFSGTADFDPDAVSTHPVASEGDFDAYVSKLNAAGDFVWAKTFGGLGVDGGTSVTIDSVGRIYAVGSYTGTANFDRGASETTLPGGGGSDAYVAELTAAGAFVLARHWGSGGSELASGVATDGRGRVYTSGLFSGTVDFDPASNASYPLSSLGADDAFVSQLILPNVRGAVWNDADGDGVRDGNELPFVGAVVDLMTAGADGIVGNDDDSVLETRTTGADGAYRFEDPALGANRYVRVSPPAGTAGNNAAYYEFTTPGQDSDVTGFGRTATFNLRTDPLHTVDAGLRPVAVPPPAWAVGSGQTDTGNGVATDTDGNTYVVGSFRDTADFDPGNGVTNLMAVDGSADGFVAKYTAAGALVWARRLGGGADDAAAGVTVSAAGDVYVTGTFTGPVVGDGAAALTGLGGTDAFVVKYNVDGVFQWAKQYGGALNDTGVDVAYDGLNNLLTVAGTFEGAATIGGAAFPVNTGGADTFVLKLTALGAVSGSPRQLGRAGTVTVTGVAVGAAGTYLTGSFAGNADFDRGTGAFVLTPEGGAGTDIFVARLKADGTLAWVAPFGNSNSETGRDIATDLAGNIYVTGDFLGQADFDPTANPFPLNSGASPDAFVLKLKNGATAPTFEWARQLGGAGADGGAGVAVDARGYVYATGTFTGTGDFDPGAGNYPLRSAGLADGFYAKLTAAGAFVFAGRLGGAGADTPAGVAVFGDGNVRVAGTFAGTADLDLGLSPYPVAAVGTDAFVSAIQEFVVVGAVWDDRDADGVLDPGEPGLTGSIVELYDTVDGVVGNGDDELIRTQTGTAGGYLFIDPPDSFGYYLQVRPKEDAYSGGSLPVYAASPARQGLDPAVDSDIDEAGRTPAVRRTQGPLAELGAGFRETPLGAGGWGVGGVGADIGRAAVRDAAGNLYVVGSFRWGADFDPRPGPDNLEDLVSAGANLGRDTADGFVAKYDRNGNYLWARRVGGPDEDEAVAVAVTADGMVLVTGTFEGTADFGPNLDPLTANPSGTGAPGRDVFVLKLDEVTGASVWAKRLGGAKPETVAGVAVDAAGNVYTAGTFEGTADFDPAPGKAFNLKNAVLNPPVGTVSRDVFVSKLTAAGDFVWARKFGGAGDDTVAGLGLTAAGEVVTAGNYNGLADFDPGSAVREKSGAVLNRLTAAGNFSFAETLGTRPLTSLAVAGSHVYLTADFFREENGALLSGTTVEKLTAAGAAVWEQFSTAAFRSVAVDAAGNVFAAGDFAGTGRFAFGAFPATVDLTAAGPADAFVSKFDAAGNFVFAKALGGAGADAARGVAVDAAGEAFVVGSFAGTADFAVGPGVLPVTAAGSDDVGVWKIPAGGVTGVVWHDVDPEGPRAADGLRSPDEPTLGGAVVRLYRTVNNVETLIGTQTAAADGSYAFPAPAPGPGYFIRVQPPVLTPALAFTGQDRGGNDGLDSDVDAAGASALFTADPVAPTAVDAGTAGAFPSFGFAWTAGGTGGHSARANAHAADAAGNVYVAGEFFGTVDFDAGPGSETRTSAGAINEAFVAKYTAGGNLVWVRQLGAAGTVDGGAQGIALDAAGNVYVAGRVNGPALGLPAGEAGDGYDAFAAKLDPAGALVWAKRLGGPGDDYGNAVAAGPAGVVVTGSFVDQTHNLNTPAERVTLRSFGGQDAFAWALAADGGLRWAQRVGGAGDDAGLGVAADAAGAAYVAGSFTETADFDPGAGVLDQTSAGDRDAFVWKLDAAGNAAWATRAGGPGPDDAAAVAVAPLGRVVVAGSFTETADFNPGPGRLELLSAGRADAFVWQLDAAGRPVWAERLGGPADDAAAAVAADATGAYVAGTFAGTADFDPGAGELSLTGAGKEAFVAKLTHAGDRQWAHRLGGAGNDAGRGVAVDGAGRVTVTGLLQGAGTYEPGAGSQPVVTGPAGGLFVGRVNQTPAGEAFPLDAFEPNDDAPGSDLGVVNRSHEIAGLSVSAAGDQDWFHFDLFAAGGPGHAVQITLTRPAAGTVFLEVFRDGVSIAPPEPAGAGAEVAAVSLNSEGPGSYTVRVSGSPAEQYTLTVTAPDGFEPDVYEQAGGDDTPLAATNLEAGPLTAVTAVAGLSVHTADNADWFAFETAETGAAASEVRIDFRAGQGDLDLELFDDQENPLLASAGVSDFESISLAGLPAGRYFARVSGRLGAINPTYNLTVRPPLLLVADDYEPLNNLRDEDTPSLGELTGVKTLDGLSVHATGDVDWFQFSLAAPGEAGHLVAIDFLHAEGDLDLRLFDVAGAPLAAATGNADAEVVSLQGRAAGTYYVQVSGFNGATQAAYRLRGVGPSATATADRLEGTAGNQTRKTASVVQTPGQTDKKLIGSLSVVDLSLTAADQDWFQFKTDGKATAQHSVTLTSDAAGGKLGLEIYSAGGGRLRTAQGPAGSLVASLNGLAAGTYYARTFLPKGAKAGGYSLTFDAPAAAAAKDDWTVMVFMTADSLTQRAFDDINEMEAAVAGLPGSVNIAVLWDQSSTLKTYPTGAGTQPAWGTVGRALVAPDGDRGQIATKFEILPEANTGDPATLRSFVDWAAKTAPAENYALVLWDHGAGLRGFNFDTRDGAVAGNLTTSDVVAALAADPATNKPAAEKFAVMAFDACFMGVAETAYNLRGVADVVVASQDAVPGDGFEYDRAFASLVTDPAEVTAEALATGLVQAFAERYGSAGRADTLSAVRTADLDPLAAALAAFTTAVDAASEDDLLALVTVAASTPAPAEAARDQRDLGGFLAAAATNGGLSSAVKTAAGAAAAALDRAVVSRTADLRNSSGLSAYLPVRDADRVTVEPLAFAEYPAEYAGYVAATGWLDMLGQLAAVADEDRPGEADSDDKPTRNDIRQTPTDLGPLGAAGLAKAGRSLHDDGDDVDWYKFQVTPAAGAVLEIDVDVRDGGVLTAELRDAAGQPVTAGGSPVTVTTSAFGRLTLPDLPAGQQTYLLRFTADGAAVPNYRFTVNPPVTGAAAAGTNGTPNRATRLDGSANGVYAGLSVAAGGHAWHTLPSTGQSAADLHRVTLSVSGGSVAAQLRDAGGAVVAAVPAGTGTLVLPYTWYGAAEAYTLVVSHAGGGTASYVVRLQTVTTADGGHPLDQFNRGNGAFTTSANWAVTGSLAVVGEDRVAVSSTPKSTGRAIWQAAAAPPLVDSGVQAHVRFPDAGSPAATLLLRATVAGDKLTAYEARLTSSSAKDTVTPALYRTVNGVSALLAGGKAVKATEGTVRFEAQGPYLRVLLNGAVILEYVDTVSLPAGQPGFAGTAGVSFDDFQAAAVAAPLPVGYSAAAGLGGAWQAVTAGTAAAGVFTLQDDRFVAGAAAAAAVYAPARLADVAVRATYSLALGQSVGLVVRESGTGATRSYYEAAVSREGTGTFVSLKLIVKGKAPRTFSKVAVPVAAAAAGELTLEARGNELRVRIGTEYKITARDATLPAAGRVGVTASAGAALGGFRVTPLGPRFADDFNRPDNAALGANWAGGTGLGVGNGRMAGVGGGQAFAAPLTGPAALENVSVSALVDISLIGVGHTVGLIARYVDANNYYEGQLTRTAAGALTAKIIRVKAGVPATVATSTRFKTTAGVMRFEVERSGLTLTLNGDSVKTTDTKLSGPGQTGVRLGLGDTLDDFTVR